MKYRIVLASVGAVVAFASGCQSSGPRSPDLVAAEPPGASLGQEGPDRTRLPLAREIPEWTPPAVTTWTMANGAGVWFLRQDQAPLASVTLVLPRGSSTDPVTKAGLTALTADLLDEGAGERSALQVSEAFQRLATEYEAYTARDGVMLSMHLLADQLRPSLELLADVVRRPQLSVAEFDRRRDMMIAQSLAAQDNLDAALDLAADRALFGDGYGGLPVHGVPSSLRAIHPNDVKKHYDGIVQPQGATFVVVGALDEQTVKGVLDHTFGDWSGAPSAEARPLKELSPPQGIYLIDFPGSTQSSVALVQRAEGAAAEDYFPAAVFNWVLGGAFTSRLNMNLRESKGYTYGARSGFTRYEKVGVFGMFAQVKAESTRASLDEMFREVREIAGPQPLTEAELEAATGAMLLGFPGEFEHLASVGQRLAQLRLTGRPANWYRDYADALTAVTLEAANRSAESHADERQFVAVIAGPLQTVEPSLEGLTMQRFYCDREGACEGDRSSLPASGSQSDPVRVPL